ncbi:hypothetical protein KVE49_07485 [Helicobacter pylori]|nr:hypothetical protein KVE49_07485 [Helicobacter pylori]
MIKEITKALVRIDDKVKENNRITQSNYGDIYILLERVARIQEQVKALKKEVAKLKQAKK